MRCLDPLLPPALSCQPKSRSPICHRQPIRGFHRQSIRGLLVSVTLTDLKGSEAPLHMPDVVPPLLRDGVSVWNTWFWKLSIDSIKWMSVWLDMLFWHYHERWGNKLTDFCFNSIDWIVLLHIFDLADWKLHRTTAGPCLPVSQQSSGSLCFKKFCGPQQCAQIQWVEWSGCFQGQGHRAWSVVIVTRARTCYCYHDPLQIAIFLLGPGNGLIQK